MHRRVPNLFDAVKPLKVAIPGSDLQAAGTITPTFSERAERIFELAVGWSRHQKYIIELNGDRIAYRVSVLLGIAFILLATAFQARAHFSVHRNISGSIVDQNGSAISGAEVTLASGSYKRTVRTDTQGGFAFADVPSSTGTITVNAVGFAKVTKDWRADSSDTIDLGAISLNATGSSEQFTVTATRTESRVSDSAQSIEVLTSTDLKNTAALNLDDALKQIQGFSLFRRSSSRTSNPTSQGVSLRGIGASGASRALVLDDGIPLDDPFGGWVYWDRIPKEAIGRIEVLQGGASSLYGTDALSGAINLIRQDNKQSTFSLETSYGNENTPDGSMFASGRTENWIGSLAGEAMNTDGYIIVDKSQRGKVDTPAGGDHSSLEATVERLFSDHGSFFVRGSTFGEARDNGTPVQTNRTHQRELDAGFDWTSARAGSFSARFFGSAEVFDQNFSAVFTGRNTEALTNAQRVPSQQIGVSAQWTRTIGSRQTAVAGFDEREVHGSSNELVFSSGKLSSAVGAGGRERLAGVFGEDIIRLTPTWLLTLGARFDHWSDYDALSVTTPFAAPGPRTVKRFPDRSEDAFSPKLSLLHRFNDHLTLSGSVYRAFRAPVLNELYRNFRVGNIITDANPNLKAERLTGYEGGATVSAFRQRLNVRGTFFWNDVSRAIANVTFAFVTPITGPQLVLRERDNLGSTRSRGVEIDASAHITSSVFLSGGYEYVDATVTRYDQNASLVNNLVPHVPRNQFSVQGGYSNPSKITVSLQGRFVGNQFDDDFNQLLLPRFFTLDALVSRRLSPNVELFGAVENILDTRYTVSLAPTTISPPTLARIGLRLRFGAR